MNVRLERNQGAGESSSEANCRRPGSRSVPLERGRLGKLLSLARRREAVAHAVCVLQVSERRACRAIGQLRTTQRYCPQPDSEQDALRDRVVALVKEYGRYGYRTITGLLHRADRQYMGKALIPCTDNRAFFVVIRSLGRKNICMHVGWCNEN